MTAAKNVVVQFATELGFGSPAEYAFAHLPVELKRASGEQIIQEIKGRKPARLTAEVDIASDGFATIRPRMGYTPDDLIRILGVAADATEVESFTNTTIEVLDEF
ncbi:hypothetical protein OIE68_15445 [Nocardia vinacea]|uniref:hypothetical protein n=1 Tax=Nocardia vinacea TaxID=96468 RepID=UPI002E144859|nr:hypothetical protein OIE68_15445 [Nocardia vinacea]